MKRIILTVLIFTALLFVNISHAQFQDFYFGADLSYVNQILDHGGVYKDSTVIESPYVTMPQYGVNLARFRLWHNPSWVRDEVYNDPTVPLYSAYDDVETSIALSKAQGMEVLLDFHYGDTWQDPGHQGIPEAWLDITDINVLGDSVYNYTYDVLSSLNDEGLMPEFVQIGNETNCGMFYSNVPAGFPYCGVCSNANWSNLAHVLNRGIEAVRDVAQLSTIQTKIILHTGNAESVNWWFSGVIDEGVTDFDIVGFSYYPIWHSAGVSLNDLSGHILNAKNEFNKEVMIMEVAYPWTNDNNDSYGNIFWNSSFSEYPATIAGHQELMHFITQSVVDGEGLGLVYWEPAWITSDMKDKWGTGSAWESNAFYDFDGNLMEGIVAFMTSSYEPQNPYYGVGDALGEWNFDDAVLMESVYSGVRRGVVDISPGTFRFFTIEDDWSSGLNYAHFVDQGYTIDTNLANAEDADQNFEFVGTAGLYVLEIHDLNKTITLEAFDFPALWAVGNAVPGGWDFNSETVELTQEEWNVWSADIELSNGEFRFIQNFGIWDTDNNYAYYDGEGYSIDANLENDNSGDQNFRFIGTPGTYTLTINANNQTITLSPSTSNEELEDREEFVCIFPNPTKDKLTVTTLGVDLSTTMLTIFDPVGKIVYHQGIEPNGMDLQTIIDLSDLPIGIYMLQLQNDGQVYSKKIVKQ